MNNRDYSLDIIRILACGLVVLMHSPIPGPQASGVFLSALSYLTAPCIGLFFMVSGALLMPVKTDYGSFLLRRFDKIAIPTLIWSLIYISLRLLESKSELNIIQSLASIPFSPQGEGVLWFMYTLAGLYLVAPILSAWVKKASQREISIVLGLWGITLCYPILNFGLLTDSSTSGILYYFTGYGGYFLLGYYLRKYPRAIPTWIAISIAVIGLILIPILKYYKIEFDFYQLFWYLSIFIAAFAVTIWNIIKEYISIKILPGFIIRLSNLTFGIYLIHILIMRHWLWNSIWIISIDNYIVQTFTIFILTFIISWISCWLISYLPVAKWIIACQSKFIK